MLKKIIGYHSSNTPLKELNDAELDVRFQLCCSVVNNITHVPDMMQKIREEAKNKFTAINNSQKLKIINLNHYIKLTEGLTVKEEGVAAKKKVT